ncbi:MAG: hypothetical protein ACFFE6_15355 [Candidatus Thorarchaeota archaeon]
MRVEVDVSDLTELTYFIDKKCEEIEKILRRDSKYAEYAVKRQHFGEDWQLDPYVIQDPGGEDLVYLDVWEIDALNEFELFAYSEVQMNKERIRSKGAVSFSVAVLVLLPIAIFLPISDLISPSGSVVSFTSIAALASFLVILLLGIRFYKSRNDATSKKRVIDLVAAREDSTFLDALRRLASLTNIDDWKREEYMKRLQYIEDSFEEVSS